MKKVVDVCCGPKGMWFDKKDNRALYLDIRDEEIIINKNAAYPKGTVFNVKPNLKCDFTNIKLPNECCYHVVFDPPHIKHKNGTAVITKQYGFLKDNWQQMIKDGFKECFRILKPNGTLIFKWNEVSFSVKEVLKLTDKKPLYGHKSGKKMNTHWIAFIK